MNEKTVSIALALVLVIAPLAAAAPGPAPGGLSIDELLGVLRAQYYGPDPVKLEPQLKEGAVKGLLDRLNHIQRQTLIGPASIAPSCGLDEDRGVNRLYTPDEYRLLQQELAGQFGGVGLKIERDDRSAGARNPYLVKEVLPGMPSERAGVKSGDRIASVDGHVIATLPLKDVVSMLRGPEGTVARIGLLRGSSVLTIAVRRELIRFKSVVVTARSDNLAVLKVSDFHRGTADEVKEAVSRLVKEKVAGLVVDLRGNPGGLLEVAVDSARVFLGPGQLIARTVKRGGQEEIHKATAAPLYSGPLVVVADASTASSGELFAAALKENRRALVVGARTFGKGSGESIVALSSGHAVKITTLVFFGPSGRSPAAGGIDPDIPVATPEKVKPPGHGPGASAAGPSPEQPPLPGTDTALEVAVTILKFKGR